MKFSASILAVMYLAGSGSAFIGLRQMEQVQAAHALAEYSANSLAEGNKEEAVKQALQAIPQGNSIFEGKVTAQAQKALTDALGVYDLRDGFKTAETLELPGAPFDLTLSPEGCRVTAVDRDADHAVIYRTSDGSVVAECSFGESHLSVAANDIFADPQNNILKLNRDGSLLAVILKEDFMENI